MAEVRLSGVAKRFGNVMAVDHIDLKAHDKEFLALVGPSGCGKTTTLRLIAGLEEPMAGDLYIGDENVTRIPPKDRDIAMVFQNYALYPHMNVYKNMSFGLRLRRFQKEEINRRVEDAAKILDIGDLLLRKPKELSGGQRQRVAMGRAIVRKPKVFLFDEPLSNLDAKLRVAMRGELAKLHERLETTIIYVTHDQIEAMTLADRIVIMDKGSVHQIGGPLDVYNHPQNLFVAGFIGSPAMNFLDVRVIEENGSLCVKGDNFTLAIPKELQDRYHKAKNQEAILGIRPQQLHDKEITAPFPGAELLLATVEVFEPVGSEVILRAACGSSQITACVDPHTNARVHDEIEFFVNMNRMHVFDKETGEVL